MLAKLAKLAKVPFPVERWSTEDRCSISPDWKWIGEFAGLGLPGLPVLPARDEIKHMALGKIEVL